MNMLALHLPALPGRRAILTRALALLGAATLAATIAVPAQAQAWPNKPIRLVVPFPAGTGVDTIARFYGEHVFKLAGQPVIVENRPGAAGNIGVQAAAKSPPDGYTLLLGPNSTMAAASALFKNPGFDPVRDFVAIAPIARIVSMLVVNPQTVPAASVTELSALMRAQPGKFSFGSGNATSQLMGEMYKSLAGLDAVHVPYKGAPQTVTDLLGGQLQFTFLDLTLALPQVRAGKLRGLAVTSSERVPMAPEIPTMAEAGVAGYELTGWYGLFAPAGTPRDITDKLAEWVNTIMRSDAAREYYTKSGAVAFPGNSDAMARFLRSEVERLPRLVRAAGIQPE